MKSINPPPAPTTHMPKTGGTEIKIGSEFLPGIRRDYLRKLLRMEKDPLRRKMLRAYRHRREGMTIYQIAKKVNCTERQVSGWLKNAPEKIGRKNENTRSRRAVTKPRTANTGRDDAGDKLTERRKQRNEDYLKWWKKHKKSERAANKSGGVPGAVEKGSVSKVTPGKKHAAKKRKTEKMSSTKHRRVKRRIEPPDLEPPWPKNSQTKHVNDQGNKREGLEDTRNKIQIYDGTRRRS